MKYDFTSIMERQGKDAIAVDSLGMYPGMAPNPPKEGFDFIPMWVADMNFPACPSIPQAIIERTNHTAYGYFTPRKEYFDSIIDWQKERHGVEGLTAEAIGYENGVHGCVVSAIQVFTEPGDKILVHRPTYIGFLADMAETGRVSAASPLVKDENGVWRMDYEDMERQLRDDNIHFAILCTPHNPSGRVWERWELEKALALFEKYDVTVVSDEIWADITFTGHKHIPTQMVNGWAKKHVVAVYAPSKTFNLAGLVGSYHIIYDKTLRDRITKHSSDTHYNEMNVLSMHALIGAYKPEGRQWTDELLQVLEGNARYACEHITTHYEGVDVSMPEGTYMLFLDCTEYCRKAGITVGDLLEAGYEVGVGWQDGRPFGGPCHIRMNLALPFSRVQEAFSRLDKYVFHAE